MSQAWSGSFGSYGGWRASSQGGASQGFINHSAFGGEDAVRYGLCVESFTDAPAMMAHVAATARLIARKQTLLLRM